MERDKKRRIEWFLGLANLNLNESSVEDRVTLLVDMQMIFGKFIHDGLSNIGPSIWDPEIGEDDLAIIMDIMKGLQDKLIGLLKSTSEKFRIAKDYQAANGKISNYMDISLISEIVRLSQLEIKAEVELKIRNKPKKERHPDPSNKSWVAHWPDKSFEKSPFEVTIKPMGDDQGFLFLFIQALDGIPLTALNQCSEDGCGKWFLQSGKRPRIFCSDRCRIRKANRERRRKIKEEGGDRYRLELKKGKERALSSRKKEIELKLGSKVKITKRSNGSFVKGGK